MKKGGAWRELWLRLLSPQTARFVLALLSLLLAAAGAWALLTGKAGSDNREAAIFAVGQLFALASLAFGYYFGSTARGDERPIETKVINDKTDPVPVEGDQ